MRSEGCATVQRFFTAVDSSRALLQGNRVASGHALGLSLSQVRCSDNSAGRRSFWVISPDQFSIILGVGAMRSTTHHHTAACDCRCYMSTARGDREGLRTLLANVIFRSFPTRIPILTLFLPLVSRAGFLSFHVVVFVPIVYSNSSRSPSIRVLILSSFHCCCFGLSVERRLFLGLINR